MQRDKIFIGISRKFQLFQFRCPISKFIDSFGIVLLNCVLWNMGLIPGLGRSLGEGNGNPLQYSCLENPMDRGTWRATVRGITRVGHDLATKPPLPWNMYVYIWCVCRYSVYTYMCLLAQLLQSCPDLCNALDCSPPGFSVQGVSPGKNTGVGCHALLQGIFPIQGLNQLSLYVSFIGRQVLYH